MTPQTQIEECLLSKQNFLLSGGAGSGKTYSLVESLRYIFESINQNARVACITYTNVAANEIKKRAPYAGLWVSTIHEFLWNEIKPFQKNLKQQFLQCISNNHKDDDMVDPSVINKIEYRNYPKHSEGIISHDDVLRLSEKMFACYPLLSRILCGKYDYILIDEYQDTSPLVIKTFLDSIKEHADGHLCIGMFGDKMQSIYESGVESHDGMDQYKDRYKEIIKQDNYRSSPKIIRLINQVRNDSVQQEASGDNRKFEGDVKFVYGHDVFDLELLKTKIASMSNWNFDDSQETKILALTHSINASLDDFSELRNIYVNNQRLKRGANDRLFGQEPDKFASLLLRIADVVGMFENKDYLTLLSPNYIDTKICSNDTKRKISESLTRTALLSKNGTIGDVITELESSGIVHSSDIVKRYSNTEDYGDFYEQISNLPASSIKNYGDYYNNHSPFSTQHNVKGAEFDNVLVNLDNGRWYQYNFNYLLENNQNKNVIVQRTRKIFYVCCSRAKRNLVVFMESPSHQALACASQWFGKDNCVNVDGVF